MKMENEITVSVNMSYDKLIECLNDKEFIKNDEYIIDDIYYVQDDIDLNGNILDILKHTILLRSVDDKSYLVYKYKEYDDSENIIMQGKANVEIMNREDAKVFLNAIGYKELIFIKDYVKVYNKDGFELLIQNVNDNHLYIEAECNDSYSTIDLLIKELNKTNIDYNKDNYFAKKAKDIFEERYKN